MAVAGLLVCLLVDPAPDSVPGDTPALVPNSAPSTEAATARIPRGSSYTHPEHACRLWGMSANTADSAAIYDQLVAGEFALVTLAGENPDGWALAYFAPVLDSLGWTRPAILRGGPRADHPADTRFQEAVEEMLAMAPRCAIAHVRRATTGHTGVPDPHPFWRDGVLFAHNGTIRSDALSALLDEGSPGYLQDHPPDYTGPYIDSELYLLYILKLRDLGVRRRVRHGEISGPTRRQSHDLADALAAAALRVYEENAIQTAGNCLLTAGDTLIALRLDANDEERYRVRYQKVPGTWIVTSEPVGSDTTGWVTLPPKTMGVFHPSGAPDLVRIYPPEDIYPVLEAISVDDDLAGESAGNGDLGCDAGEQIELAVTLRNDGILQATNVRATLSSEDSYVEVTDATEDYGDIAPGASVVCLEDFDFSIDPSCPDGRQVDFHLLVESEDRLSWEFDFVLPVSAPVFVLSSTAWDDTGGGNGNGRLDPGETVALTARIENTGHEDATEILATLSTPHAWVTVTQASAGHDTLEPRQIGALSPPFAFTIDPACPNPDLVRLTLDLAADWGQGAQFVLDMPIGGFFDDIESGEGNWTSQAVTPGCLDQWHRTVERNFTPGGVWSWKCGGLTGETYADSLDAVLESEPVVLRTYSYLRFHHFLSSQLSGGDPGAAIDGGRVELSINGGPWEPITPLGGYPSVLVASDPPAALPPDTPVYGGWIAWAEAVFEITGASGEARFRFRFVSDGDAGFEGWYVDDIEFFGTETLPAEIGEAEPVILRPALAPARPNPTRRGSTLEFAIPRAGRVRAELYDAAGRRVRLLADGPRPAGVHALAWDGRDEAGRLAPAGVYFCRLRAPDLHETRKIVLTR